MSEGDNADGKIDWSELEPNYPVKIFMTVLYSLILVTGIVGNSITVGVTQILKRNGYLHKTVTEHMVSLASSDLLVLLIGMPVELYSTIWFPFTSVSGNVSCKIYNFLFEACSYATILNVWTLSFERYIAICYPLSYKHMLRIRTTAYITFAWVLSMLIAVPLLFATGTQGYIPTKENNPVQNLTFCTNLREHWWMYRVSIFVAFFVYLFVLACVAFMCWAMIKALQTPLRFQKQRMSRTERVAKHETKKARMARKQTIIFLGLIVLSLMVCWLPNQIHRLMKVAVPKSDWNLSYFRSYAALQLVADTFFYLSSVLNPFLYNLSSKQFRKVFVQVLRCRLTIQHVNKRTMQQVNKSTMQQVKTSSARSLQPLLLKSLHRKHIIAQLKTAPTDTMIQTVGDSEVASNNQTPISLTEGSVLTLTSQVDGQSETEI